MTNSEIFKAAHERAKTFRGDYRACFVLALRIVRSESRPSTLDLAHRLASRIEANETDTCSVWANYGKVRIYVKRSGHQDAGYIDCVSMTAIGNRPGNQDLLSNLIKTYA